MLIGIINLNVKDFSLNRITMQYKAKKLSNQVIYLHDNELYYDLVNQIAFDFDTNIMETKFEQSSKLKTTKLDFENNTTISDAIDRHIIKYFGMKIKDIGVPGATNYVAGQYLDPRIIEFEGDKLVIYRSTIVDKAEQYKLNKEFVLRGLGMHDIGPNADKNYVVVGRVSTVKPSIFYLDLGTNTDQNSSIYRSFSENIYLFDGNLFDHLMNVSFFVGNDFSLVNHHTQLLSSVRNNYFDSMFDYYINSLDRRLLFMDYQNPITMNRTYYSYTQALQRLFADYKDLELTSFDYRRVDKAQVDPKNVLFPDILHQSSRTIPTQVFNSEANRMIPVPLVVQEGLRTVPVNISQELYRRLLPVPIHNKGSHRSIPVPISHEKSDVIIPVPVYNKRGNRTVPVPIYNTNTVTPATMIFYDFETNAILDLGAAANFAILPNNFSVLFNPILQRWELKDHNAVLIDKIFEDNAGIANPNQIGDGSSVSYTLPVTINSANPYMPFFAMLVEDSASSTFKQILHVDFGNTKKIFFTDIVNGNLVMKSAIVNAAVFGSLSNASTNSTPINIENTITSGGSTIFQENLNTRKIHSIDYQNLHIFFDPVTRSLIDYSKDQNGKQRLAILPSDYNIQYSTTNNRWELIKGTNELIEDISLSKAFGQLSSATNSHTLDSIISGSDVFFIKSVTGIHDTVNPEIKTFLYKEEGGNLSNPIFSIFYHSQGPNLTFNQLNGVTLANRNLLLNTDIKNLNITANPVNLSTLGTNQSLSWIQHRSTSLLHSNSLVFFDPVTRSLIDFNKDLSGNQHLAILPSDFNVIYNNGWIIRDSTGDIVDTINLKKTTGQIETANNVYNLPIIESKPNVFFMDGFLVMDSNTLSFKPILAVQSGSDALNNPVHTLFTSFFDSITGVLRLKAENVTNSQLNNLVSLTDPVIIDINNLGGSNITQTNWNSNRRSFMIFENKGLFFDPITRSIIDYSVDENNQQHIGLLPIGYTFALDSSTGAADPEKWEIIDSLGNKYHYISLSDKNLTSVDSYISDIPGMQSIQLNAVMSAMNPFIIRGTQVHTTNDEIETILYIKDGVNAGNDTFLLLNTTIGGTNNNEIQLRNVNNYSSTNLNSLLSRGIRSSLSNMSSVDLSTVLTGTPERFNTNLSKNVFDANPFLVYDDENKVLMDLRKDLTGRQYMWFLDNFSTVEFNGATRKWELKYNNNVIKSIDLANSTMSDGTNTITLTDVVSSVNDVSSVKPLTVMQNSGLRNILFSKNGFDNSGPTPLQKYAVFYENDNGMTLNLEYTNITNTFNSLFNASNQSTNPQKISNIASIGSFSLPTPMNNFIKKNMFPDNKLVFFDFPTRSIIDLNIDTSGNQHRAILPGNFRFEFRPGTGINDPDEWRIVDNNGRIINSIDLSTGVISDGLTNYNLGVVISKPDVFEMKGEKILDRISAQFKAVLFVKDGVNSAGNDTFGLFIPEYDGIILNLLSADSIPEATVDILKDKALSSPNKGPINLNATIGVSNISIEHWNSALNRLVAIGNKLLFFDFTTRSIIDFSQDELGRQCLAILPPNFTVSYNSTTNNWEIKDSNGVMMTNIDVETGNVSGRDNAGLLVNYQLPLKKSKSNVFFINGTYIVNNNDEFIPMLYAMKNVNTVSGALNFEIFYPEKNAAGQLNLVSTVLTEQETNSLINQSIFGSSPQKIDLLTMGTGNPVVSNRQIWNAQLTKTMLFKMLISWSDYLNFHNNLKNMLDRVSVDIRQNQASNNRYYTWGIRYFTNFVTPYAIFRDMENDNDHFLVLFQGTDLLLYEVIVPKADFLELQSSTPNNAFEQYNPTTVISNSDFRTVNQFLAAIDIIGDGSAGAEGPINDKNARRLQKLLNTMV